MSTASDYQPRYAVDDYAAWDGDWELWNGVAVSTSPSPSPLHQSAATKLAARILSALEENSVCEKCNVISEVDWHVSADTVVRPDILITCDPLPETHITNTPVFVAEILSPSTANKDRTAKRALYQSEGVRYYTLIDPIERTIESLSLKGDTFQPHPSEPLVLNLTDSCQMSFDTHSVFS